MSKAKPKPLRGELVTVDVPHEHGPRRPRRGQPTKLDSERAARICRLIRSGSYRTQAAVASGIHASTFHLWMLTKHEIQVMKITSERTADGVRETKTITDEFLKFSEMVERAEAECEAELAGRLMLASQRPNADGIRASIELLQRRFRERWKQTAEVEHTGTIELDVAEVRQRVYGRLARLAVIDTGKAEESA